MLAHLQLEQNHAGAGAGAYALAIATQRGGTISCLDSVQRLDLGDNYIEDSAMGDLIRGLAVQEDGEEERDTQQPGRLGLGILDLHNNHFGLAACHQLKVVMVPPPSEDAALQQAVVPRILLTQLNLNGCSVGAAGATVIGEMLRNNSTLRVLGLAGRRPNGRRALMSDDRLGAEGLRVSGSGELWQNRAPANHSMLAGALHWATAQPDVAHSGSESSLLRLI
jgi:hypothetical protein